MIQSALLNIFFEFIIITNPYFFINPPIYCPQLYEKDVNIPPLLCYLNPDNHKKLFQVRVESTSYWGVK